MSDASPNSIVSASELVVRYGLQTVLDQATLTIHEGERGGELVATVLGNPLFSKLPLEFSNQMPVNSSGAVIWLPAICRKL